MTEKSFEIRTTAESGIYEGIRDLWCDVFGDEPEYVDGTYENFGEDITGWAVTDTGGRAVSALSCYRCGTFRGQDVYVSYAVCTSPDHRGQGLAGMLVDRVREDVLAKGGISVVSPLEPSLEKWYAGLGYEPYFHAPRITLFAADDDDEEYEDFDDYDMDFGDREASGEFRPGIVLEPADRDRYNMYREAFLANRPHVELSGRMLRQVEYECFDDGGLYVINGGDAICDISTAEGGSLVMTEFILSPVLGELSLEIDEEITLSIARQKGAFEVTYTTPGSQRCQSMAAGVREFDPEEEGYEYSSAYYGFPID
ncbi:MAG: GNAT family N-acetyltransferase [Mogibacterium sp.]|nr:GNAT family N-acetyltransferase [Mogibacterium sp.]